MCSNYQFPSKKNLRFLGVDSDQFDLDVANSRLLPKWAKAFKFSITLTIAFII